MSSRELLDRLENYIRVGIHPILLEGVYMKAYKNAVILDANCSPSELDGHYENENYLSPKWYEEILNKSKNPYSLLVIPNINKISKKEQLKFFELFKYKKVSTFELPENCIIIATCTELKEGEMSEEIYSLMAQI